MERPQHPMLFLGSAHEYEAHEGRLSEIETTGTVITQERLEALSAVGFREIAPIQPLDDPLPRANKGSFLQRLVQRRYHLLEVDAPIHSADGVEKHSRLHRRQLV